MKTIIQLTLFICTLFCISTGLVAQDAKLSHEFKETTVNKVTQYIVDYYVFPEIGKKVEKHIQNQWKEGHFKQFNTLKSFADALTTSIQEISNDKHLTVNVRPKKEGNESREENALDNWVEDRLEERMYTRRFNANFKTVKKLEGNVGYLDLRGFYGLDLGQKYADYAMAMLASSDAIMIDLRNNSGGRGDMVGYLASYFFNEKIILSKTRKRKGDQFIEAVHWSQEEVNGKKLPDVPVFILTSSTTFSAAEGFSYPMQVYKRATFVGEVTKGGANPGDLIPLNDELEIFVSDVSVTHPLTNSSWEGVGIIPDVKTNKEEAYDVAYKMAKKAAEKFKAKHEAAARKLLFDLNETMESFSPDSPNSLIIDKFIECKQADLLFEEWEVNGIGYNLLQNDKPETAEAVFEANTLLYPNSANVHDSYAEALVKNGRLKEAIASYKKAVALAEKSGDENLGLFVENLEKIKARVGSQN